MKSCGAQTFRVFVYRRRPFCDLSLSDGHTDRFKSTVLFTFTLFSSIICGPHRVGPKPLTQTLKGQSTFQHSECVRSDLVEEKWPKWPVYQQSTKTQKTPKKLEFCRKCRFTKCTDEHISWLHYFFTMTCPPREENRTNLREKSEKLHTVFKSLSSMQVMSPAGATSQRSKLKQGFSPKFLKYKRFAASSVLACALILMEAAAWPLSFQVLLTRVHKIQLWTI